MFIFLPPPKKKVLRQVFIYFAEVYKKISLHFQTFLLPLIIIYKNCCKHYAMIALYLSKKRLQKYNLNVKKM